MSTKNLLRLFDLRKFRLLGGRISTTRAATPVQSVRWLSSGTAQKNAADHPWLAKISAPPSFLAEERILTYLAGNAAAGNLAAVARDWEHLPKNFHKNGLEIVLQTHLFAGFPRAINALATIHQVGIDPPDASWAQESKDLDSWHKSGDSTCGAVYGGIYPKLRKRMQQLHPVLDSMMLEHGYGRTLSRPGPGLRLRELCVIAVLSGQDVAPQLASHLRGALRAGSTREELDTVIAQTALVWGETAAAQAKAALETLDGARLYLRRDAGKA